MEKNDNNPIRFLFEPACIAVIGASANKSKIGYKIIKNIIDGGYKGNIYPVNQSGGTIDGLKIFKNINDIDDDIDAAVIAIPAEFVVEAVKSCALKKVKYLQIISSGFSEIGNIKDERLITQIARESGMRVVGPNIFGLYSSAASLNSTFAGSKITPGRVAILTQSGALGIAMIGKTAVSNIGLSAIVSLGNKCDVDESDLLEYLTYQDNTRVILLYIEGVKNGEKFIESIKKAVRAKPVVVIKSGTSKRGAEAAASHTGSLAGSDEIFNAIIKQCGVQRAESIEDAFNWCKFLAESPMPRGDRGVIITNGGGVGVMATDSCEKFGISLFDDREVLKKTFGPFTPSFGSTKNPIDITGSATSVDYINALSASASSANLDSVIALYCETATFDSDNLADMIKETCGRHTAANKPITYGIIGGEKVENAIMKLRKEQVPVYNDVTQAVSSLGSLYRYYHYLKEKDDSVEYADIDETSINNIIDNALIDGRSFLLSNESFAVMKAAGVKIPESRIGHSIGEVIQHANDIGYPVVLKVVSRDILHKSDAGGVALHLDDEREVMDAYEAILHKCKAYNPNAKIDGIEVGEMVDKGTEMIIGARRDPSFGPVVMCGLGGIYVEVMKDISFRALPLNRKEIMSMLKDLRTYTLLLGVRGESKKDIDSIIETVIKVASIIKRCGKITDIEINPVVVYDNGKGIKAIDNRILISK